MNRRDFLKRCLAAGVGLGACSLPWPARRGWAALAADAAIPDLVTVRGGEPDAMFDCGIAALGGLARFIRPSSLVAVKPNISWNSPPELASTTHPALVGHVVRRCLEAGAGQVVVFDHSVEYWRQCWTSSGIAAAVQAAGGEMTRADAARYYRRVPVHGTRLSEALVHQALLDCDVLISLPILKQHDRAGLSAGMKNLMGAVWDRRVLYERGLHQCIADLLTVRRPDLTVIDAYRVLAANGPRGRSPADVRLLKTQILATDAVAADAAAARLLAVRPGAARYIAHAHRLGLGQIHPRHRRSMTVASPT